MLQLDGWADGQHPEGGRFGRKTMSMASDVWGLRLPDGQALSDILFSEMASLPQFLTGKFLVHLWKLSPGITVSLLPHT